MSSHEISTKCQRVNRKISEWLHMELMSLILILQIYIVHNSDSEEEMTTLTQFQNANAITENAAQQDNYISPSEETPNPHDINSHSHDNDMTDISSSQRPSSGQPSVASQTPNQTEHISCATQTMKILACGSQAYLDSLATT